MIKKYKISKFTLILVILAILLILFLIWHRKPQPTTAPKPPPVAVQKPILEKVSDYITETGNTVAYNSVDLVARIPGYLKSVEFTDGTFVNKGDTLFIIEPEPYAEKLNEAKASVTAQKAGYAYAEAEYKRQQKMYKENATSLNNVQKWLAQRDEAQANIQQAVANEEVATINYSYTHVKAPFSGRIARHLVDPGNLVGNGAATKLATLDQLDPIYVYFNLNELDLVKVRKAARAAGLKPSDIDQVPVYVRMANEKGFPHKGKLNFINTGLNASTGTIEFRALFPNKNYTLLPGLFVQIRIDISKPIPRLTVPDTAVQYDQIGPYLLLMDTKKQVVLRRVTLGNVDNGLRVILKGLNAEDNVIVNGLQNATPGKAVTLEKQG